MSRALDSSSDWLLRRPHDTLGLIIALVVMAASVTDNAIAVRLLDKVVAHIPTVTKEWVDTGFKDDAAIRGAVPGIDVEQVKRNDTTRGWRGEVLPLRNRRAGVPHQGRRRLEVDVGVAPVRPSPVCAVNDLIVKCCDAPM